MQNIKRNMTTIQTYQFHDIPAVKMENDRLQVIVIPESGGKLQSIFDKLLKREFLYQSADTKFKRGVYGGSFLDGDLSGFDDMFPSINSCLYPDQPWQGVMVPDHGEVWSLPWKYKIDHEELVLTVHGVKFPYMLEKRLSFQSSSQIRADYMLWNFSPFSFKYIWAAHPLLNIEEGSRLILPTNGKIINALSGSSRLGVYGSIHDWPIARNSNGETSDMRVITPNLGKSEKYYILGETVEGKSVLYHSHEKQYISFSYPPEKVKYLGVWVNENGPFIAQNNVAIEPCTGLMDSIEIAEKFNQLAQIEAYGQDSWFLLIETGQAENIEDI